MTVERKSYTGLEWHEDEVEAWPIPFLHQKSLIINLQYSIKKIYILYIYFMVTLEAHLRAGVPVWMFFQHLVDAYTESLIVEAFCNEIFVDPELRSRHRLTLRNLGEVKSEFSVMATHRQKLLIVFNCGRTVFHIRVYQIFPQQSKEIVTCTVNLNITFMCAKKSHAWTQSTCLHRCLNSQEPPIETQRCRQLYVAIFLKLFPRSYLLFHYLSLHCCGMESVRQKVTLTACVPSNPVYILSAWPTWHILTLKLEYFW